MRRGPALLAAMLLITIAMTSHLSSAAEDPQARVLAEQSFSESTSSHLVEWFSTEECQPCRDFEGHASENHGGVVGEGEGDDVAWVSWVRSDGNSAGELSRMDATNRMDQLGLNETPALFVDGVRVGMDSEDDAAIWDSTLRTALSEDAPARLVDSSLVVSIIDTDGDGEPDSIRFSTELTPLVDLHNETAIHVHIIEWSVDPDRLGAGGAVPHVLREWVPRLDFSVEAGNSTSWEYTLTETYLDSAGIDLSSGDSDRYGFILSLHGDARDESDSMRVLHVVQAALPSLDAQSDWGGFPLVMLIDLLLLVGLGMIVLQERVRELGLPRIEGRDISTDPSERRVELCITAGNRAVKVTEVKAALGWRIARSGRKPDIKAGESGVLNLRIRSKDGHEGTALLITIKTDVEDLGQWLMDVDMT